MAETQTMSELDQIMQPYIDSGQYSDNELAEIRKRQANLLKEKEVNLLDQFNFESTPATQDSNLESKYQPTVIKDDIIQDDTGRKFTTLENELEIIKGEEEAELEFDKQVDEIKSTAKNDFENYKSKNQDKLSAVYVEGGKTKSVLDYDDTESIKKINQELTQDHLRNNEYLWQTVWPEVRDANIKLINQKAELLKEKYQISEDSSQEDLDAANAEMMEFQSGILNDDERFQNIVISYANALNEQHAIDKDGFLVDKHTWDKVKQLDQYLSLGGDDALAIPTFGLSKILSPMTIFKSIRGIGTSMDEIGLAANGQRYQEQYESFQNNLKQEEKDNWTDETVGYTYYGQDKNDLRFKVVTRNIEFASMVGTKKATWGDYKKQMEQTIKDNEFNYKEDILDLFEEQRIDQAYEAASFDRLMSGDNTLRELSLMVSEQGVNMVGALISYGTLPAMQEGASVYTTLIRDAARAKFGLGEDELPTPDQLYETLLDDSIDHEGMMETAAQTGVVIGQLERFSAGKLVRPMKFFKKGYGSMVKGQYKRFLKDVMAGTRSSVEGGFTEFFTEGLQTTASSVATGNWSADEFRNSMGTGAVIGVLFPFGGNVMSRTTTEMKAAYDKVIGKFDKNTVENVLNSNQTQLDQGLKNGTITKEEHEEKSALINSVRSSNDKVPNNFSLENKKQAVDLLLQKEQLQKEIDQIGDKSLSKNKQEQLDVVNASLEEVAVKDQFEKEQERVEKVAGEIFGEDVRARNVNSEQAIQMAKEKYQEELADPNITSERKALIEEQIQDAGSSFGFYDPETRTMILNKEASVKQGFVTTASHEFLHAVLQNTIQANPDIAIDLGNSLGKFLMKMDTGQIVDSEYAFRVASYQNAPSEVQGEEMITLFSEAISRGDIKFNETIFTKLKDTFRRFLQNIGFKNIEFNTGKDVYNFIKDYNKAIQSGRAGKGIKTLAIKGATGKLITPAPTTEATATLKESKSNIQGILNEYGGVEATKPDLRRMVNETLIRTPQGQETFDITKSRFGQEIEPIVEAITKRLYDKIPSDATRAAGLTRADYKNALVSEAATMTQQEYDATIQDLDTFISNRLNLRAESLAKRLGVEERILKDVDFIKETDIDVATQPTKEPTKKEQARKLSSLSKVYGVANSIDLNSKVQSIIEQNPKNLKAEITNLIKNDIRKAITKQMGDIKKVQGELVVTEKYKEFLALNYENIVQGLDVATIKNNYNQLFELTEIGKEDKKTKKEDKPTLKKDSNYRKAIFKIETNKAKFTKFFTEGGYTTLKDRQKKLAILIAESVTENIINSQIIENSGSLDAIIEVEMKEFANSLNRQKKEVLGNYNDQLKFSLAKYKDAETLKQFVFKYGFDNVFNEDGTVVETYRKQLNEPDSPAPAEFIYNLGKNGFLKELQDLEYLPKLYQKIYKAGKRGTAFETNIINTIISLEKEFGEATVYAALRAPSEVDGLPDVVMRLHNKLINIEAKMSKAQYSSVTFSIDKTGKFFIKKDYTFGDEILKELSDGVKEGVELSKARLKQEGYNWKDLSILPDDMYYILKNERVIINGKEQSYLNAMSYEIDIPLSVVSEIYNKKKHPVNYMHLMGRGLFYMGGFNNETNVLNTPELAGMAKIKLRIGSNSQYKTVNKVRSKTGNKKLAWRAIPTIPNSTLKTLTPHAKSLDTKEGIRNIVNSPEAEMLKMSKSIGNARTVDNAIRFSRKVNPSKGITVLDFDDTLATTKSLVKFTKPDGTTGTLNAEQYASTYENLLDKGYVFDFSDFNKVVKGKLAPLFNKAIKLQSKFGPENMFVLTARPPMAAKPIFDFLKANGLNIPLKNITGLANSTSEAKALWIADKVGEGYNDFYFADDALQNVQAVKNMLDQFDVKSKVQQAKLKFSNNINEEFNNIIESTTGVESEKQFSNVQARIRGAKGKYKGLIPASAQDFMGLMYNFLGKGKQGDKDMAFFKKALVDPFARGINELNASKQSAFNDLNNLFKKFKGIKKKLRKKVPTTKFTQDQAVRVYLWNKYGFEIPGISKRDLNTLNSFVEKNSELKTFADNLSLISKRPEGYKGPDEYWITENIQSDFLSDGAIGDVRSLFLQEWIENKNIIFSMQNLNKIEAIYGSKFREALEDMLYRMETGSNRPRGANRLTNTYMNWVNNSVGAIMFFNIRSAALQTISATNYINWTDNNPLKAGLALANQKQYWKDFSYIFNSDMLRQRRRGNQRGVNEAELMRAVVGSANPIKAGIAYLLNKGFLPTQIADSFAIASGGATFYRNRIKTYLKQGLSQKEAQERAWLDFQETTEVAQQSARPDLISQQQANPLGRLILAFQNTPMQYGRIMNKAVRDIANNRGDLKTHISKIIYYGAVQAIIFNALQSALFASIGDEEELDRKKSRIIGGMIEGWLAAFGYGGKAVGTLKRSAEEYLKQRDKGFRADHAYTLLSLLGFSPPIGSKLRKIYSAINTEKFNKDIMKERGFTLDNPLWQAIGYTVEGITNVPLGAISQDLFNLDNAMDPTHKWWQRLALVMGWNTWDLGIKDPDLETLKLEVKQQKNQEKKIEKEQKKKEKEELEESKRVNQIEHNKRVQAKERNEGKKDIKCAAINRSGKRCGKTVEGGGAFCTIHEEVKQSKTGKKVQCKKTKSDGKRCKMKTSSASGYCYYHD